MVTPGIRARTQCWHRDLSFPELSGLDVIKVSPESVRQLRVIKWQLCVIKWQLCVIKWQLPVIKWQLCVIEWQLCVYEHGTEKI